MNIFKGRYRQIIYTIFTFVLILGISQTFVYRWNVKIEEYINNNDIIGDLSDELFFTNMEALNYLTYEVGSDESLLRIQNHLKNVHDLFEELKATESANSYLYPESGIPILDEIYEKSLKEYFHRISKLNMQNRLETAQYILDNEKLIYDYFNSAYTHFMEENVRHAKKVRSLQILLLIFGLSYLFIALTFYIHRLNEADLKLAEKNQEIEDIMATVKVGLFLIEKDLTIDDSYSQYLLELLGDKFVAGDNFTNLLDRLVQEEDYNQAHEFIELLYSPRVKENLIHDLNPLQEVMIIENNKKRFLKFSFSRVYNEQHISRVLVNVSDITSEVALKQKEQNELAQSDFQLMLFKIIQQMDKKYFHDFIQHTLSYCDLINQELKSHAYEDLIEKQQAISRYVHSIKGEASALNFKLFVDITEKMENELTKIKGSKKIKNEYFFGLVILLEELFNLTHNIQKIISHFQEIHPESERSLFEKPEQSFTDYYQNFVQEIAERQKKKVNLIIECEALHEHYLVENPIQQILLQTLRNAIAHGIECPDKRKDKNKDEIGQIKVELKIENRQFILSITDDGNGINYQALKEKALLLKLTTPEALAQMNQQELNQILFQTGFSTASEINEDAGQGVGLNIIEDKINKINGTIQVETEINQFTRFIFNIPM